MTRKHFHIDGGSLILVPTRKYGLQKQFAVFHSGVCSIDFEGADFRHWLLKWILAVGLSFQERDGSVYVVLVEDGEHNPIVAVESNLLKPPRKVCVLGAEALKDWLRRVQPVGRYSLNPRRRFFDLGRETS